VTIYLAGVLPFNRNVIVENKLRGISQLIIFNLVVITFDK